jgi:hypothetical protein
MVMKRLIADVERAQLLDNAAANARGDRRDPLPVVKLYTPDARAVWLLTELDPEDGDTAYGLSDAGLGAPELGHVRLSDLESIRGPHGLLIARDPTFTAKHSLSEYFRRSQADGSIND